MSIKAKVNGETVSATGIFVKVSGSWKLVTSGGPAPGTPVKPVLTLNVNKTAITWPAVSGSGGPTLGYGWSVTPNTGIVGSLSGTTLNVTSVTEEIPYEFEVWGVNVAGRGESGLLSYTWAGVPAPVITTVGVAAGVKVDWVAAGGATSYVLEYKKKTDPTWVSTTLGAVTTYTITPLLDQVVYQVRVVGKKSNVTTQYSNIGEATPLPGIVAAPTLSYTADGQFTIGNFDGSYIYDVVGCSRNGSVLSGVSNGATVTAALTPALPSAKSTMNVLVNSRILTPGDNQTSTGCGGRDNLCCPGGQIMDAGGTTCGGAPGSFIADPGQAAAFCNGQCDDNCWQLTVNCYNWYWSNYSSEGYTLIGNTWGKATNG